MQMCFCKVVRIIGISVRGAFSRSHHKYYFFGRPSMRSNLDISRVLGGPCWMMEEEHSVVPGNLPLLPPIFLFLKLAAAGSTVFCLRSLSEEIDGRDGGLDCCGIS